MEYPILCITYYTLLTLVIIFGGTLYHLLYSQFSVLFLPNINPHENAPLSTVDSQFLMLCISNALHFQATCYTSQSCYTPEILNSTPSFSDHIPLSSTSQFLTSCYLNSLRTEYSHGPTIKGQLLYQHKKTIQG